MKFDAGIGQVYAACWSGAISIVQEDDPQLFQQRDADNYDELWPIQDIPRCADEHLLRTLQALSCREET